MAMHEHDGAISAPRRFPALAPWLTCGFEHERATFSNGVMFTVMKGVGVSRYVAAVTPFLDGRHSVEDIACAADTRIDYVRQIISTLEQADLIIEGEGIPSESPALASAAVAASCWGQFVDVVEAAERLEGSHVTILGSDSVARLVTEQLVEMGLACSLVANAATSEGELPEVDLGDFLVVGPSVVHLMARSANRALYEANVSWLPVFPFNGRFVQVGPLIVPPDSGCFECFVLRRQANVSYSPDLYDEVTRAGAKSSFDFSPLELASAATAAFVVHQWLAVRHPAMPGVSYLERADTWKRETHHLLRVPRCPVCSAASERGIPAAWWSTS